MAGGGETSQSSRGNAPIAATDFHAKMDGLRDDFSFHSERRPSGSVWKKGGDGRQIRVR